MQNDKKLIISVGQSRKAINWKAVELYWSEFVQRLSVPQRSTETLAEYKRLTKSQQDELKDVGGFVGGQLNGSRRKSESVISRSLVTLDLDNIPAGQTEDILKRVEGLGCAYIVYSTRKHESAAPRLRVILPPDRDLTADEYEPVARKLASLIGIEFCDPTTFDVSRLMYWSSCCRDSEYIFTYSDKGFVSADGILGMYGDWHNVSEWPSVPGETERLERNQRRQEDPTTKKGIIGAFCRVYDVPAAMDKFLPGIYEETSISGRYTYTAGSTVGGAVLYDDGKFLYSHHATDPVQGRLCNSFDLVRLHKFGYLDEEAKPDTPIAKLPSTKAMSEFASQDKATRLEGAKEKFRVPGNEEAILELDYDGNNKLKKTAKNIMIVIENDPDLAGKFRYDKFSDCVLTSGGLPWNPEGQERELTDADMAGLRVHLETKYDLTGISKIQDAFDTFLQKTATHAVRDYLKGLRWDGEKRLDTVLIDYLGAKDADYTKKVTRKLFCAAVARVFNPGVKYDYLVVLIGAQGTGKSTFARIMGVNWFSDSLKIIDMKDKTAVEKLMGVWVGEIQEMDGFNKVASETVKSFLSSQADKFRPAYGRHSINRKRQFVLIGTANKKDFLTDETGNRRYFPVDVGIGKPIKSVFSDLRPIIDQIWAEAFTRWQWGESIYPDSEMERLAAAQQEDHMQEDPREGMIEEFLKIPIPSDWYTKDTTQRRAYIVGGYKTYQGETAERSKICAAEVWHECFGYPIATLTQRDTRAINAILSKLLKGWERNNTRYGEEYGRQRGFFKSVPP